VSFFITDFIDPFILLSIVCPLMLICEKKYSKLFYGIKGGASKEIKMIIGIIAPLAIKASLIIFYLENQGRIEPNFLPHYSGTAHLGLRAPFLHKTNMLNFRGPT